MKIRRGRPRAETRLVIEFNTADQLPEAELLRTAPVTASQLPGTSAGGSVSSASSVSSSSDVAQMSSIVCGLIVMLDLNKWTEWMPMCCVSEVLHEWGPDEQLARLDFKLPVVGLHLLVDVYICTIDRLEEEGCIEILVCTSGSYLVGTHGGSEHNDAAGNHRPRTENGEPKSLFGVPLPKRSANRWLSAQPVVDFASLRVWPTKSRGPQSRICFVLSGEEKCPVDSVICMIWRMFSKSLAPVLARRVAEAPISVSAARFAWYRELERKMAIAAQRAEAAESQPSFGTTAN